MRPTLSAALWSGHLLLSTPALRRGDLVEVRGLQGVVTSIEAVEQWHAAPAQADPDGAARG